MLRTDYEDDLFSKHTRVRVKVGCDTIESGLGLQLGLGFRVWNETLLNMPTDRFGVQDQAQTKIGKRAESPSQRRFWECGK